MNRSSLKLVPLGRVLLAIGLALIGGVAIVRAFAEEPLGWRDPATGITYGAPEISTVHDDMTYVLALAAGFNITDARTLQTWNQLVDSEALPGAVVSYTNGGGAFYTPPNSQTVCGGTAITHSQVIWPRWGDVTITDSVTTRFGPYSPFFHFPHIQGPRAASEIGALRAWGWGDTPTLNAYEAYAWGRDGVANSTVLQATCRYTRSVSITTTIAAGSLAAFGTYLHTLADGYSHLDCITALDALGLPWATHTTPPIDDSVPACDYYPRTPAADDVHGREFYTYTDSIRTVDALRHVYQELTARSLGREGVYVPIGLDTVVSGTQTLSDTIAAFVQTWDFDQPQARRAYADQLATHIQALSRTSIKRVYLPIVLR